MTCNFCGDELGSMSKLETHCEKRHFGKWYDAEANRFECVFDKLIQDKYKIQHCVHFGLVSSADEHKCDDCKPIPICLFTTDKRKKFVDLPSL